MQPIREKNWKVRPVLSPEVDAALADYPIFMRQLLFNRGCIDAASADRYLNCKLTGLEDPFMLSGMEAAVLRICAAIDAGEKVVVYGDYDVDGVTAAVLLVEVLQKMGALAEVYIPNRVEEGYGLNCDSLDTLHHQGVRLVVTVDCGIRSQREAQHALELGLDLVITDHHHCAGDIPQAAAVINPRQPGDAYPEKELAGVGLAYKLAQALLSRCPVAGVQAEDWLDLVALGTVADLAQLSGENRVLVRAGLEKIRRTRRQGLLSLIGTAGLKQEQITAMDIGFGLGPRLNAAGRMESAMRAYNLLTDRDVFHTGVLAQELEIQNRERQDVTKKMQQAVMELVGSAGEDLPIIFAADAGFKSGVVGLTASRILDLYHRPVILAERGEEFSRGSCRSIPGFHITEALDRCSDLLERHGGHAAAAGFTVRTERLDELKSRLSQIAVEQLGDLALLRKTVDVDMELPLAYLRDEMFSWLDMIQPTGYGNPEPVFVSRNLKVLGAWPVGKDKSHLKLKVSDGKRALRSAIAFRLGHWYSRLPEWVDLLYAVERNEYNGNVELQLNVKDIKASESEPV